jgi:hypothetical protein
MSDIGSQYSQPVKPGLANFCHLDDELFPPACKFCICDICFRFLGIAKMRVDEMFLRRITTSISRYQVLFWKLYLQFSNIPKSTREFI